MKVLGRVAVFPVIPERISRLYELAFNLWWSWNRPAQELYEVVDSQLWDEVNHNPVRFLSQVSPDKLNEVAQSSTYLANYDKILAQFDAYMHPDTPTWFSTAHPDLLGKTIAYFSAEFGLHEALPIYSGGLGILSGDHCKAASDLGLPFVGIGFLYPQGYFIQRINREGGQEALYEKLHFSEVPATPALNPKGEEVVIWVDLPGRRVYAKVWRIQVGRIPLFLMDTDVDPNRPSDRELSARLYGGDHELRVAQEIVLGIGGVRAVRELGINPYAWHMNEGHSAFLGLERVRELVQGLGLSFNEAREAVMAGGIFTTHTPVPAGNDAFSYDLIDKYFNQYWPQLGLSRDEFLNFARQDQTWGPSYSMTVLALKLSGGHNGVSQLHGVVSRKMWEFLWPGVDSEEVPITHITNGVHTQTWLAPELRDLYTRYLPAGWEEKLEDPKTWENIAKIPDAELWEIHSQLKVKLLDFIHKRVKQFRIEIGEGTQEVIEAENLFDPKAFTIGFARRFATYKRATLIFRHVARIQKILNDPQRPVQIVFAGKAHPADEPGKSFIQQVYQISQEEGFEGKIIFLENYDMNMARYLVAGVDIWLNNPIRPMEASGTSGQKAALNGAPNASILDGWWPEAYNGKNGWAIGEERSYQDQETADEADSQALYELLENDIVPLFYKTGPDGIPHQWIQVMKESIKTVAPVYNTRRMVRDYTEMLYIPAIKQSEMLQQSNFVKAKELAVWKRFVTDAWQDVTVEAKAPRDVKMPIGAKVTVDAWVRLGRLSPNDVTVELISAHDNNGVLEDMQTTPMTPVTTDTNNNGQLHYVGEYVTSTGGSRVFAVRVLPNHPYLLSKHELGLVRWA
ncbi:MAG TPA: alpha-glucan family phosphorylase [Chloroflexia bacterium]|nr:alpha-glucan family phosphorylase [Chloroflexia bacterium]